MATIHNADAVKSLLRSRGKEDGLVWRLIYAYRNAVNGESAFAIYTEPQYCDIYQSPYVYDPVCLMQDGFLTLDGARFLGVDCDEFNNTSPGVVDATYVSVFDDANRFESPCKYNPETKLCFNIRDSEDYEEDGDMDALTDQFVIVDGEELREEDGVTFDY